MQQASAGQYVSVMRTCLTTRQCMFIVSAGAGDEVKVLTREISEKGNALETIAVMGISRLLQLSVILFKILILNYVSILARNTIMF